MNASNKMNGSRVVPIVEARIRFSNQIWGFSSLHASKIDRYWRQRLAENSELFNGAVLLLDSNWSLHEGRFSGSCLETDFKTFLYWREHGAPDANVVDFFAAGALHSEEGWLILARMSAHHSSAGRIFSPCGSLHIDDVKDSAVDLDGNIFREIHEETGLGLSRLMQKQPILIR
jgi:hypothetical protein